ncbi:MAG: thioesterase family protein [Thermotogota bacterium]
MKTNIDSIIGKEFDFNFRFNSEDLIWVEDEELSNEKLLSTSSLIEEIHESAFKILSDFLETDETSVVSNTALTHISLTPYNTNVYIKIIPENINNNNIYFVGEAFDEINKIADFKLTRTVVSKNYLKKEKYNKLKKLTNI